MSVDDLADTYNRDLLDQHCPLVTVRHKVQPMTQWFDTDCRAAQRQTRAAERRFRRTCVEADKQAWLRKCKALRALYEQKSCDYWRNVIAAGSVDTKRLWNTLHAVLGETRSEDVDAHTADEFAAFFGDKVASVRAACASTPLYDVPYRIAQMLEQFAPVTVEEVDRLIGIVRRARPAS